MKIPFVLALGMFALSCGGGGGGTLSQPEACPMITQASCAKLFTCNDVQLLLVRAAVMSEEGCRTYLEPSCPSACPSGQTYHGDKAKACLDATSSADCAKIAAAIDITASIPDNVTALVAAIAPACNEICTN